MNCDSRQPLREHTFELIDEKNNNHYTITVHEEINRGGSCIVYWGSRETYIGQEKINKKVIIKEFYPKMFGDLKITRNDDSKELEFDSDSLKYKFEQRLQRFCQGQVNHICYAGHNPDKTLPSASCSGKALGTFYVVSDPGVGKALSEIDLHNLEVLDALEITASLCDAINAVHNEETYQLYLDCKPSNIFVNGNKALLFDFDTAIPKDLVEFFCCYSDGFSAPEQMLNERRDAYSTPNQIGYHSDIYSIAAVLFWMLTGMSPSESDFDNKKKDFDWKNHIILKDSNGALKEKHFFDELDRIIRMALEPNPQKRKKSFSDQKHTPERNCALELKEEIKNYLIDSFKKDASKTRPVHFNLPNPNDWFTGRKNKISEIEDGFSRGSRIQILYGMGGMGKTQIAKEYLLNNKSQYTMTHWINASTIDSIIFNYNSVLNLEQGNNVKLSKAEICHLYFQYLNNQDNWLIVFDNCDYYKDAEFRDFVSCLPKECTNGHILITTRNNRKIGKAEQIEVDVFNEEDAIEFLIRRAQDTDKGGAKALAERLGCLPLALELAGAYISATPGYNFKKYLNLFNENSELIDQVVDVVDYEESLTEVIKTTFNTIVKNCKEDIAISVREIMSLVSYLSPHHIVLDMFVKSTSDLPSDLQQIGNTNIITLLNCCCNDLSYNEISRILVKYSLLRYESNGFYSMHELQQEIIRRIFIRDDDLDLTYSTWSLFLLNKFDSVNNLTPNQYQEHLYYHEKFMLESDKRFGNFNSSVDIEILRQSSEDFDFWQFRDVGNVLKSSVVKYESLLDDGSSINKDDVDICLELLINVYSKSRRIKKSLDELMFICNIFNNSALMCLHVNLVDEFNALYFLWMDAVFLYFCQQFYEEAFKINTFSFNGRIINCSPDTTAWETEIIPNIVSTWNKKYAYLFDITPLEVMSFTNAYLEKRTSLLPKDYQKIILHVLNHDIYKLATKFISKLMFLEAEDGEIILLEKGAFVEYSGEKYIIFFSLDKGNEPIITRVEYSDEGTIYQSVEDKNVSDAVLKIYKERSNDKLGNAE